MKTTKRLLKINLLVILCLALLVGVFVTVSAATADGPALGTGGNIHRPVRHVATRANIASAKEHTAYIKGYKDGTVRPMAPATRAEAATIFYRLMDGQSRNKYWTDENKFHDVASSAWYNSAVSTVSNAKIIKGYGKGIFKPDAPVTRAEFVTMLIRFFGVPLDETATHPFTDVAEGSWAEPYIAAAYAKGWVKGSAKQLRPDDLITRAEVVIMVNRAAERAPHKDHLLPDMKEWSDNLPGTWYYESIQEATNSHYYKRIAEKIANTNIRYEDWIALIPNPNWKALEQAWAAAYGGK